eukprot:CAMPEP_0202493230 /NCGR_PEP_ID=MMETSP1361-20130828/9639_1 /ASSEMBLY_ACC=CAM_ASM_000849 /TAXON_ID=210615 /ORGANISM="Staurosira complex sp., Strain CCMP2646" /LENGTH=479 /DNA_ID=CAMNT_0049123517 /DNA_START=563 /DNA_END=2002 /DNA_ORIENTATION=-
MKAVFRTSPSGSNNNPLLSMTSLGWFFDLSLVPQCFANGTAVSSCCNKAVNDGCPSVVDTTLYNLGVSFQTTNPICITGVGFNKASSKPAATDLWNAVTKANLASNSSSSVPDSSGWQESMFDSPFPMNIVDSFIASYLLQDNEGYAFDHFTFTSSTPVLQAGPVSAKAGFFAQDSMSSIPLQTYPSPNGANYFVTPLWTHDLCVCGHSLDSDEDKTPDCDDGCPDDASFTDTCDVGCTIPIQQSAGAMSGIFEAPVGSGNLYKLEYVVDLVNYGDAKFLVRPESHKMAFRYLGSESMPANKPRPGTNNNCLGTGTSIFNLLEPPFFECSWDTRNGVDPEGFFGTMKFEYYGMPTQEGIAKAPSPFSYDPRTLSLIRNVKHVRGSFTLDSVLYSMIIRNTIDMVDNRNGCSHKAYIYNQCKGVNDAEFSPKLPEGAVVSCPGLSKKVAVNACSTRQTILNKACKVDYGNSTVEFDVRFG